MSAVSPAGSATNVAASASVVLTFSAPMAEGMDSLMDVHQGTTAGALMPMTCSWSADRTALTCTHATPFAGGATYTIHVGAGMTDANGMAINMDAMVNQMGGVWLQSGMMGGMHAGQPTTGMSSGWHGANGSYGMMFTFTTM
ncbi:MAG TPA: Ig-like domain-containing protein [Gemmatimonadales bacterium]|nr:Ig-like domain-containing protein [Gemmatimonadales bacterium]